VCVGLFAVGEEQTLDERAMFELEFGAHFFHIDHGFMFVQLVVDGKVSQMLQALLPVGDTVFLHK
jgi:hypothetical protein